MNNWRLVLRYIYIYPKNTITTQYCHSCLSLSLSPSVSAILIFIVLIFISTHLIWPPLAFGLSLSLLLSSLSVSYTYHLRSHSVSIQPLPTAPIRASSSHLEPSSVIVHVTVVHQHHPIQPIPVMITFVVSLPLTTTFLRVSYILLNCCTNLDPRL